jgi:magnesium-transporting ATPase (P-type)
LIFDPGHFVDRFFSPFNSESRFYWPSVYAVVLAFITNIVWYNWRRRGAVPPAENALKSWAFWMNIIFLILMLVWLKATVPFWVIALTMAVNLGGLFFLYRYVLPPQEAAWQRERRRQQYFPQPGRRKKRRAARR